MTPVTRSEALAIACPYCKSEPGRGCKGATGSTLMTPHQARRDAVIAARRATKRKAT